jgi:hypothetical protein
VPVALEGGHRAFDAGGSKSFPDERVAAFSPDEIHDETSCQRAECRGEDDTSIRAG